MGAAMPNADTNKPVRWTAELILVLAMLVSLLVVVILVLHCMPLLPPSESRSTTQPVGMDDWLKLIQTRKDILSILLTAFGAWIGAGAAYFFGRESLREAASSLLKAQGITAADR